MLGCPEMGNNLYKVLISMKIFLAASDFLNKKYIYLSNSNDDAFHFLAL